MSFDIIIRLAMTADASQVRACAEDAYACYVADIGQKPAPMVADFPTLIAQHHVHVATGPDGQMLGFIVFYAQDNAIHLENVAVCPNAAGRGIGKRLIAFCEATARRNGARAVTLYTNEKMTANLAIYPHLGYTETGRRQEDGFHRVYFEKRLSPLDG